MEEPVLVDQAHPKKMEPVPYAIPENSMKWGRYRMPKIYRFPDGSIALTYSMSIDHYYDQGRVSPLFISKDEGKTWTKTDWPHPGLAGMHPVISPVFDGEYYTIPAPAGIRLDEFPPMPAPDRNEKRWENWYAYRLLEFPKAVQDWFRDVKAMRWSPKTGWAQEQTQWDHKGQYVWAYDDKWHNIPGIWSQKLYLEGRVLRVGNELFLADYWTQYEKPDGSLSHTFDSYLMVSSDNGRSWKRRATMIAFPHRPAYEPVIEMNRNGELVCVVRTDLTMPLDGVPEDPCMHIAFSKDNGHTWSAPQKILGYGVFPRLLLLDNGVMVLSYGRSPGTRVSFSLDGGHTWTPHWFVIDETGKASSCGYTSLLALDRDSFLLAYGDIHCKNADGEECKTILTRKITVKPVYSVST